MNTRSPVWRWLRRLLLVVVVLLAVLYPLLHEFNYLGRSDVLARLELILADQRLRSTMPATRLDPRIVIVAIDEKSLAELGRWPWSRDRLAELTEALFVAQQAQVVGFDMVFAEPDLTPGLATFERFAASSPEIARRMPELRAALDRDALFGRALAGHDAVLGYFFSDGSDARKSGVLPAPVFGPDLLGRYPVKLQHWAGYGANLEALSDAAPAAGYFNHTPASDGLVRAAPLVSEYAGLQFEALSLAMYRLYAGRPSVSPGLAAEGSVTAAFQSLDSLVLAWKDGRRQRIAVGARANVRIPFRGPGGAAGGSYQYVSASDLLSTKRPPAKAQFAGKLVLVGVTAAAAHDVRSTPVGEVYPGVEVHANLLSGLLDGALPIEPAWASGFEVLQSLVVAGLLVWRLPRMRAARAAWFALALGVLLIGANAGAFRALGLALPLASSLVLGVILYVGFTVWGFIVEGRTRRSLARLFGNYVPTPLIDIMSRDPGRYSMEGETRELSVMFCDMRDFTRVSEGLPPERLRQLMNLFFSAMTEPIYQHRGTLDKYIGDAVMAFWGAPVADANHAANAVRAALAMSERLPSLNAQFRAIGFREISFGIGITTGEVDVGDMGSKFRRSYTVMGDVVNQSSRIEGVTKHYGLVILANGDTVDAVEAARPGGQPIEWRWLEVDRVRLKGKEHPVTLFTPIRTGAGDAATSDDESRLWQLALAAYRLQHWDRSEALLEGLQSAHPASSFCGLYRQLGVRIERHRHHRPPADWDGTHTFDTK